MKLADKNSLEVKGRQKNFRLNEDQIDIDSNKWDTLFATIETETY